MMVLGLGLTASLYIVGHQGMSAFDTFQGRYSTEHYG